MGNLFSRWFGKPGDGAAGALHEVRQWAEGRGWRYARARGGDGFAVEAGDLRLEWGPSQRDYLEPSELRVRRDLGDCGDLQLLLMSRQLMTVLEQEVFEQATEGNRTRVDDRTPEEVRWLVLFPKLPRSTLGALAEHIGALSNHRGAAQLWLQEPLRAQVAAAVARLAADEPMAMIVQRGRFVLRQALAEPTIDMLEGALALATVAAEGARAVGLETARGTLDSALASAWGPPSALPSVDPPAR
jgi:hypothetical protein